MKTSQTNTRLATLAMMAGVLALAACAPEPAPKPSGLADTTPTPAITATPAEPEPEPEPTETPTPDTVSADEAGQLCLDNQSPWGSYVPTGPPVAHERAIEPRWFVLIPGENENGGGFIQCIVSADPNAEHLVDSSEIYGDYITEEYIEWALNNNPTGL